MGKFALIATMLIALLVPAMAQPAEDPAVSACDTVIKLQLRAPKTYERVRYFMQDNVVYMRFDAVNSFNAPIRSDYKCAFEQPFGAAKSGIWMLLRDEKQLPAEIRKLPAPVDIGESGLSADEMTRAIMRQATIEAEAFARDMPPIRASETALKMP